MYTNIVLYIYNDEFYGFEVDLVFDDIAENARGGDVMVCVCRVILCVCTPTGRYGRILISYT